MGYYNQQGILTVGIFFAVLYVSHQFPTVNKVINLLDENGLPVRPEIYNNIGSLHIRMRNLGEARSALNKAMEKVRMDPEAQDAAYTKNMRNTIRYNIARLSEEMYAFDKAILLYKDILTGIALNKNMTH